MSFEDYLQNKKLSANTIRDYQRQVGEFTDWMEKENLKIKDLVYSDLLKYIAHLRQGSRADKTIAHHLGTTRHYLDYKVVTGEIKANPAQNLTLKGIIKKIPGDLLNEKELDSIYQEYQPLHKYYKIMLGLFIYQGLTVSELEKLKHEDMKLNEGKINVPGSRKSNGRLLELKPFQILDLHEYIKTRPKDEQLFISSKGSLKLDNTVYEIFKQVQKLNIKAINAKQLRASVIANKLKSTGLRETQYFAGHRYVSSTERYKMGSIENLKKQIQKHHPLNGF